MKIDVSIVLTLHDEGRIAHRSFKGIGRAMSSALNKGVSVELVVIMDRVRDVILEGIVDQGIASFKEKSLLLKADFGSLSLARNLGIENSQGEFIAISDGDDLFCKNWIYKAFKICSANPMEIAHPEASYYFPYERFIRFSNGGPEAIINLIIYNQWTALTMAHRDIFYRHKYVKDVPPYAFQDWLWNCETAAKGYRHVIVPETVLAIRQKPVGKSLYQNTHSQNKVVRDNVHFRKIFLREYDILRKDIEDNTWVANSWYDAQRRLVDYCYKKYPNNFKRLVNLRRTSLEKIRAAVKSSRLPLWLTSELQELSHIDPSIQEIRNIDIRRPDKTNRIKNAITPGMSKLVGTKRAKVYILDKFGKDHISLNAFNYISAQESAFLITTEKAVTLPLESIRSHIIHIPIGNSWLFFEERLQLLHRLLLETDTEYIHIINSRIGYRMLDRYKKTFNGRKVFTTLLATSDIYNDFGWELKEYSDLLDSFSNISTDLEFYKNQIQNVYGVFRPEITRIDFPYDPELFSRFYDLKTASLEKEPIHPTGTEDRSILIAGLSNHKKTAKKFIASISRQISRKRSNIVGIWDFKSGRTKPSDFSVFDSDICIIYDYFPGMSSFCTQILGSGIPVLIKEGIKLPEFFSDDACFFFNASDKEAGTVINQIEQEKATFKKGSAVVKSIQKQRGRESVYRQISDFYETRLGFDGFL